ncbi:MAG: rod shape-determining protein RodA [Gammaproteobacteria bacterium]
MINDTFNSHTKQNWLARWHIDIPLLFGLLTTGAVGLVVLYSASGQNLDMLINQAIRLGLALLGMVVVAQIPPQHLRLWTPWLFGLGLIMLVAVLLMGQVGKGAQRWLDLGVVRFQPAEILKLALPMMVAWYLADSALPPRPWRMIVCAAMIVVPVALIAKQPDLGTALLVACAGFFALFLAGLRWRVMIFAVVLIVPIGAALWNFGMHDYQRQRVLTFLDPETDPLGAGYHIIQSMIAVGSGGVYGKGWLNGTQSHLDFLPERHTDFIFAVLGEEFGLIGAIILLMLYSFLIVRGLYIATQAQDTYTRLLAGTLTLTFFVYVFVNAGMVTGLLPVVGVPLPLVSYGGTAVVTLLTGFGMLMSIHTHRKLLST